MSERPQQDVLDAIEAPLQGGAAHIEQQLRRMVRADSTESYDEEQLRIAVLLAFPDRVLAREGKLIVAVDVQERPGQSQPIIRLASEVEPEWLLDFFPDRITEQTEVVWNRQAERVESISRLLYDGVVIEESQTAACNPVLLAEKAREAGLDNTEEVQSFCARVSFAAAHSKLKPLNVDQALLEVCDGKRSLREVRNGTGEMLAALKNQLGRQGERTLSEIAPECIRIGSRQVPVQYIEGQPPAIASRLQDFFGMKETPRVARGAVPVVVHLLAPNKRPVQLTTDLAGFWDRLYPQVRKELARRYPRHSWPEDPRI